MRISRREALPAPDPRGRRVIVCHCHVVSDRRICAAVDQGACTVEDVGADCAAGTRCGSCQPTIGALLATLLAPEQVEPAA